MKINSFNKSQYILNARISDFTEIYAQAAKFNKRIAQKMVFKHGLNGEVDDKFVRKVLPEHFDEAGMLTEKGKANIKDNLSNWFGLKDWREKQPFANNCKTSDYLTDFYIRDFGL